MRLGTGRPHSPGPLGGRLGSVAELATADTAVLLPWPRLVREEPLGSLATEEKVGGQMHTCRSMNSAPYHG